MSEQKYNLPLSTPKGSDLDRLLKQLIDGIKSGQYQRTYFEISRDEGYPDRFQINIDFKDISTPLHVLDEPDKAWRF